MDHDRVVAVRSKNADLQQRCIAGRADEHREVMVSDRLKHPVPNRMENVLVVDSVQTAAASRSILIGTTLPANRVGPRINARMPRKLGGTA